MTIDGWEQDRFAEQVLAAMEPGVWYDFGDYDPFLTIFALATSGRHVSVLVTCHDD